MKNKGASSIMDAMKNMLDQGMSNKDAARLCRALIAFMIVAFIISIVFLVRAFLA